MGTYEQGIASQGAANKSLADIVSDALNAKGFTQGSLADRTHAFFKSVAGEGGTSKVAMMVSNTATPAFQDNLLRGLVEEYGFTVELLPSTSPCPNAGYSGVVVTESGTGGSAANVSIPACTLPVVHLEGNWNTVGMSTVTATNPGSTDTIDITAVHPITATLPDPMVHRTLAGSLFGVPAANLAPGAVGLAEHSLFPGHVVAAAIETGGSYAAGMTPATAPARRVSSCLGTTGTIVNEWTADAKKLFKQQILWAFGNPSVSASGSKKTLSDYYLYYLGIEPNVYLDPSKMV